MTSGSTATTMVKADTSSSTPSGSSTSNDKDKDKDSDNTNTPSSSNSNGSPPSGGRPPARGTNANNPDASTDTGTTGTTTGPGTTGTTAGPGTLPPLIGSTTKCDNFTQNGKCGGGGGKGGGGTKPKPTVICPEGSHLNDGKCTPCHYYNGVNGSQTCVYIEKKIIERHTTHYVGGSSSSKSKGLTQIPSNATDFPGDDTGVIQVHVTSANKDIIGAWHVKGEITNVGNDTLQFVRVTIHFYDSSGGLIGDSSCCYSTPDSIEPHHTVTFDSFANKDEITAIPSSYRLSFDWQ